MRKKVGRPPKYNQEQILILQERLKRYIVNTQIPIIAEFAYKNNVARSTLYEYEELSTLLKKAVNKKATMLERFALRGKVNCTMAIFSLKQLGWSDKQNIEHSGDLSIKVNMQINGV